MRGGERIGGHGAILLDHVSHTVRIKIDQPRGSCNLNVGDMADSIFEMNLRWAKDEKGFSFRNFNADWNADSLPEDARIVRNGGRLHAYEPAKVASLLKKFMVIRSPQQLLAFVNSYGPLTLEGFIGDGESFADSHRRTLWSLQDGEGIEIGLEEASAYRDLIANKGRTKFIAKRIEQYSMVYQFKVAPDSRNRLRFVAEPRSLLDLLRLSIVQSLMGASSYMQCRFCAEFFERGIGTSRRADAQFCSDQHRIRFNSQRRSL